MNAPEGIKQIGDLSKDSVFLYDLVKKKFIYTNKVFDELLEPVTGTWKDDPSFLLSIVHLEDTTYLKQQYELLILNNAIQDTEFRLMLDKEKIIHITCDAFVVDKVQFLAGFIKDISREKEHEDYIIDYGARKDTLLDMLSHNLSGPLLLSQNIMRWMQKQMDDRQAIDMKDQLLMIQDNTQHCLDIVNDFLKEEHLESQRIFVKKTRFDLLERIRTTLEKLIVTNRDKEFRLITSLEHVNITTDSVKFFQAIHNLVSNSIKFTPPGGKIDILVEETEEHYLIRVADDGIGIPKQFHKNLFDKKTIASRKGLKNESSSGMGLFIVKALVELMNGRVWFESTENVGTVFTIELPK